MSGAIDKAMLDLAARLALRAQGDVEPNPIVGAVLARDGRVIGMGHHRRFGGFHAEREAIEDCRRRGESPKGATLYCTLEPCAHVGKQPACTTTIIEQGLARVVYARKDPNPVAAGGAAALEAAGVRTELCESSTLAVGINVPFVKRLTTGLPWVIAKWAQTIDGRLATRSGDSKWISSETSRRRVHRLRARVDAIVTGLGTVLADDPQLTARGVTRVRRRAIRVVCDTDLQIPLGTNLVRTARETPTIVACARELVSLGIARDRVETLTSEGVRVVGVRESAVGRGLEIEELLATLLRDHGVCNVLVEAGPGLIGSLFERRLVDEAIVFIGPMLLGDEMARSVSAGRAVEQLRGATRLTLWRVKRLGNDMELTYRTR
ncbi:MAG: bifunctional diaminohydroxyphosphoribosylaminopyrimidine deaminase/5-amino-6-(5-phosphoribosylamino)uracil reductase RibD [Phycisphaerales bacterium]|nr:MAG: bifunctional diaminohydroxyphosphoribosylaminopyrimidine deaminase/5-amino-6-(5-phosphoribosylamino)uracil reductase RibD [Phycisphaerales bacterium]